MEMVCNALDRVLEEPQQRAIRDRELAIPVIGRTLTMQCSPMYCLHRRSFDGGKSYVGRSFEIPVYIFENGENGKVKEEYCRGLLLPGEWFGLDKRAIFVADREFSNGAVVNSNGKDFYCFLGCLINLRED